MPSRNCARSEKRDDVGIVPYDTSSTANAVPLPLEGKASPFRGGRPRHISRNNHVGATIGRPKKRDDVGIVPYGGGVILKQKPSLNLSHEKKTSRRKSFFTMLIIKIL